MNKILVTLAALAMSAVFAFVGAPAASANPELCWNGFVLTACVQGPGWVDWNPGWDGGWNNKHWNPGHGHWK